MNKVLRVQIVKPKSMDWKDFGDILTDVKIVEVLFPLEKNYIENPYKKDLLEYFK